MNDTRHPDWSLWRSFDAVMQTGSLTAAAKKLDLSQPTLGRHIEALEAALGVTLFDRQLRGLTPTETAYRLQAPIEAANRALASAEMVAAGSNLSERGTVRLTASTVTAHYSLPGLLREIRLAHPEVDIEILPSDTPENILMRDADIAIRMFRPTQAELITRKIAESRLSACAHRSYLDRRGTPQSSADLVHHDLVGFDKSDLITANAHRLGFELNRTDFATRTDSQTLIWELVKAGLGIGFAQDCLIDVTPGMVRLLPGLPIPPLEVWLTTHKQLYVNRRIRVIYDELARLLGAYYRAAPA
ncbi:MAG: LysR family transcriptional regulator [Hyphomicrobiaceae bacterium]|nr:LysR family transcriptional regulator [Hyphomicrobiaceae bacterium]